MGTRLISVDGGLIEIDDRLFRQQVRWNHELVSDRSTARPRWQHTHRFTDSATGDQIEVLTLGLGPGYIVRRNETIVADAAPAVWPAGIWGLIAAVQLAEVAFARGDWMEVVHLFLATSLTVLMITPRVMWSQQKRTPVEAMPQS